MGSLSIEEWRGRIGGFNSRGYSKTRNDSGKKETLKGHRGTKSIFLIIIVLVYADVSHVASSPIVPPTSHTNYNENGKYAHIVNVLRVDIMFTQISNSYNISSIFIQQSVRK